VLVTLAAVRSGGPLWSEVSRAVKARWLRRSGDPERRDSARNLALERLFLAVYCRDDVLTLAY